MLLLRPFACMKSQMHDIYESTHILPDSMGTVWLKAHSCFRNGASSDVTVFDVLFML